MTERVEQIYRDIFESEPMMVRSPGRINVIGEHTDYNDGFVLPAAIDKSIYVAAGKSGDDQIHLYAVNFNENYRVALTDVVPLDSWPTYVLGVVDQLRQKGLLTTGFNMVIDGDVPVGAGLSSSAAVECAVVFTLSELFGMGLSKMEMVQIAQKAEHTFSGVLCGIMDMFASMFGKKDHVIKLDCRSLDYEYKPLRLEDYQLVLLNSNVKHSLASSAYNERRMQCEQGIAWVQASHPQVKSLRDVNLTMLEQCVAPRDALIYKRCKYVIEEISRVSEACLDLERGDITALGTKMFASHEGLSKSYEVSCKELDFLVAAVSKFPAVLGSRMMGGGFGGCSINIIKSSQVEEVISTVGRDYRQAMQMDLTPILVSIEDGTSLLKHQTHATV